MLALPPRFGLLARALLVAVALVSAARPLAAAEADPATLLDKLEATWKARDVEGYLALFPPGDQALRAREREYVQATWSGEESRLEIERPAQMPSAAFKVSGNVVAITEPRGHVEQVLFAAAPAGDGWALTDRQTVSQIDGLVHLSLGPEAFRADGLILRLPDFEMRFQHGTLFTPPPNLGPTALVFVGEATVRFSPGLAMEREQLRQFCGRTELVETVHAAFFRIHPADLHHILTPMRLEPAPHGEAARPAALRFFREHVDDTYQLDARLPRAPWWLMPPLGDAVATFQTRRGALTLTISHSEPEGISLFDRARRRQICLYPLPGTEARYDEDEERDVDVVHHDLSVKFDPDRFALSGVDILRLRLRNRASTIRLRLDESLRVLSIRSREGGEHLFFRVRHQDGMMVSLGALSGTVGEVTLTVRYAGTHQPQPVEREVLPQVDSPITLENDIAVEETTVYSNRTAWYPQGDADDYATADLHLDVPAGMMAVSGGQQASLKTEGGRTRVEYRQELPGKYITVAVGHVAEAGRQADGGVTITAWATPRLKSRADARIAEAAEILRFYATEFGPCPYPLLNLVLLESRVPGGHSPPGMIVVSIRPALLRGALRDDPASFPEAPDFFIAHELAHQWWGHGVAGQNYHERWMSEAFAQYAAAMWVRHSRGEAAFRDMLEHMGRWALRYSSKGPIYLGHRLGHIEGDPQVYRAIVYDKGAYVLHMLRQIVGEDAFRKAGIAFQAKNRFRKVGTEDFRVALETASGLDLKAYFTAWIYDTRLPDLRVATRTHSSPDGYRTEITVRGQDLPGPLPLEVEVTHLAGTEVRTLSVAPEGGSWTIDTPDPPRRVDVNVGRGLLARIRRN